MIDFVASNIFGCESTFVNLISNFAIGVLENLALYILFLGKVGGLE